MRGAKTSAFALVEVVLALGIASYILIGIIGLISVGGYAGRASIDDTVLVSMTNRAVSDLRRQDFATLVGTATSGTSTPVPGSPVYFDAEGQWIENPTGSGIPSNAIYQCTETMQPDADTLNTVNGSYNLLHVRLQFAWPAHAANPPNTRSVYVVISGH